MEKNMIEFMASVSSSNDQGLILQTAAGTFIGNPLMEDSESPEMHKLLDAYKETYPEESSSTILLENVRETDTNTFFRFLIFSCDSILAISYADYD